MANKVYLGDSLYAEETPETGDLMLYTNNGRGPERVIYLGPSEIKALQEYLKRFGFIK